ncbi:MAG TPA: cell division protein ZipA C-terminal FtsZ-binding domain-containing protein [Gammaproteobacteria bacterium]
MDDLRLVLLILGVVLVVLLYLWGKRRARKDAWDIPADADLRGERVLPEESKPEDEWEIIPLHAAREPRLDDGALERVRGIAPHTEPLGDDIPTLTEVIGTAKPPKPLPEIVVALTIIAKRGQPLSGKALIDAMRQVELRHGTHRIFHRITDTGTLFSLANILEPGTFDLDAMDEFTTPGVALFARLPGKHPGSRVMQEMIATAQTLAKLLDANLCDERRALLTEQGIARLLDKARPYAAVTTKTQ